MRLPRQFSVRGKTWTLKFVPVIDGDPDTAGRCYPDERVIRLRTKMSKRLRLEIWLHELAHVIEHEYKIELPHRKMGELIDYLERVFDANGLQIVQGVR